LHKKQARILAGRRSVAAKLRRIVSKLAQFVFELVAPTALKALAASNWLIALRYLRALFLLMTKAIA
jgi:hypothetical protein